MRNGLIAGFFAGLLLLAAGPGTAVAEPFEDAQTAFDRGEFPVALEIWSALAEAGDGPAQHKIAHMYSEGRGVSQDNVQATKWFLIQANKGDSHSQHDFDMIKLLMTPAQIAEAVALAQAWKPKVTAPPP